MPVPIIDNFSLDGQFISSVGPNELTSLLRSDKTRAKNHHRSKRAFPVNSYRACDKTGHKQNKKVFQEKKVPLSARIFKWGQQKRISPRFTQSKLGYSCTTIYENESNIQDDLGVTSDKGQSSHFTANNAVTSLIAMLQGVEVLCNLAIMYMYKDEFHINPAMLGFILAALRIPWSIKPLWALAADNFPLFGYRRKSYIILGSTLCAISTLGIGLAGFLRMWSTTLLLLLYFTGSAICNVIGEALVVSAGRSHSAGAAQTVSIFFAFRKLSFAMMSYLSGILLDFIPKQHTFLIATILPVSVLISSFFLEEENTPIHPFRSQLRHLLSLAKEPSLLNSTMFIFLMMSTPSAGSAMFFFMTNELRFSPELLGRMALFQSIASLLGIITYMWFFSTSPIKKLLLWSTVLVTPFCLIPCLLTEHINVKLGIPASALVMSDTAMMEFIGEFQSMPILVLAAKLCPVGLESTVYSFILSSYNLGLGISSILSAGFTSMLNITATNFQNLTSLIVICAMTNLLPLTILYLIPEDDAICPSNQEDKDMLESEIQSDEKSTSVSEYRSDTSAIGPSSDEEYNIKILQRQPTGNNINLKTYE